MKCSGFLATRPGRLRCRAGTSSRRSIRRTGRASRRRCWRRCCCASRIGSIERDHYGKTFSESITPPNLVKATYASERQDAVALEFDQPVVWTDALASQFYLDGEKGKITFGSVTGNVLTLKLATPSTAQRVTYLDSKSWNPTNLLYGANGIAALTFCNVPLISK